MPPCSPIHESAVLVNRAPAIIAYECACGNEDHSWSAVAYEAASTWMQDDGSYLPNVKLAKGQVNS